MANRLSPTKIEAYMLDFSRQEDVALLVAMGLDTGRPQAVIPLLPAAGSQAKRNAVRYLIENGDTDDLVLPILDSIQDQREKQVCLSRELWNAARLNQRKELETLLGHPDLPLTAIRLALYTSLQEKNTPMAQRLASAMDLEKMRKYLIYRQEWGCLEDLAELIPVAVATDWVKRHTQHFHHLRGLFLAQTRANAVDTLPLPMMDSRRRARS